MNPNNRYAPAPRPTETQVNEYACTLAKEEGISSRALFNLIRWPSWATPPMDDRAETYNGYVRELREKARRILTEQMAAQPQERIKRCKKKRKPNKYRYWTTRSTKHGKTPPPRKRGYMLKKAPHPAQSPQAPPGGDLLQEISPSRCPCRHERETLLFPVQGNLRAPERPGIPAQNAL